MDCKYKVRSGICKRPLEAIDLVKGTPEVNWDYCYAERKLDRLLDKQMCGPTGRFFQQNTSVWYRIKKWVSSFKH